MPWYKAGTVSVAQNSNAVTGSNTSFIANSRVGDAFLGPDGRWYEVTNIASDTAMAISPNYLGPTASGGTYALAPMQGYVKDSADALRALVNQFGARFAALSTAANLTAQTSTLDANPNRAMIVGAFGIGGDAPTFTGNIDSIGAVPKGRCFVTAATTGTKPAGFTFGILDTISAESNQGVHQTFHVVDGVAGGGTLRTFQRDQYGSGAFGPWRMDIRQNNVIGTVTSDMSGVGSVVEYGSNTNGRYTKFAGGLMICETTPVNVAVGAGGITGGNIALPATFINTTITLAITGAGGSSNDHYGFTSITPVNTATVTWIFRNGAVAQNIIGVRVLAIGRWFA
jgi:hypothetical protein